MVFEALRPGEAKERGPRTESWNLQHSEEEEEEEDCWTDAPQEARRNRT